MHTQGGYVVCPLFHPLFIWDPDSVVTGPGISTRLSEVHLQVGCTWLLNESTVDMVF